MNTPIDDGGPAFPVHPQCSGQPCGMSTRAWFAGQELIAMGSHVPIIYDDENKDFLIPVMARARHAVAQADAMIAALKEKTE